MGKSVLTVGPRQERIAAGAGVKEAGFALICVADEAAAKKMLDQLNPDQLVELPESFEELGAFCQNVNPVPGTEFTLLLRAVH